MSLAQSFKGLFNAGKKDRVSLEIRPDGIAWSRRGKDMLPGFVECTPARRREALLGIISEHRLTGAETTLVLPLDQYQVFQLERPEALAVAGTTAFKSVQPQCSSTSG